MGVYIIFIYLNLYNMHGFGHRLVGARVFFPNYSHLVSFWTVYIRVVTKPRYDLKRASSPAVLTVLFVLQALLTADFEIGHYIRERVVSRAVLLYTGEGLDDDDDDEYEEEVSLILRYTSTHVSLSIFHFCVKFYWFRVTQFSKVILEVTIDSVNKTSGFAHITLTVQ